MEVGLKTLGLGIIFRIPILKSINKLFLTSRNMPRSLGPGDWIISTRKEITTRKLAIACNCNLMVVLPRHVSTSTGGGTYNCSRDVTPSKNDWKKVSTVS